MVLPHLIAECDALSFVFLLFFLFQLVLGNKIVVVVLVFLPYLMGDNLQINRSDFVCISSILKLKIWTFKNVGLGAPVLLENNTQPYPFTRPCNKWVSNHTNPLWVYRVVNLARVWVINPIARLTLVRSISSNINTGEIKLGCLPGDGPVSPAHPRVLHLPVTGRYHLRDGSYGSRTPSLATQRSYKGE